MNQFRRHRYQRNPFVVLVLLSLLLQVQTVFACQMMDHGGSTTHCCCDEMKAANDSNDKLEPTSPCCDFSSELTLKGADLEAEEPVVLQSQASLELPHDNIAFIVASLWPIEPPPYQQTFWNWKADPGQPGTDTYLSTLRLRI